MCVSSDIADEVIIFVYLNFYFSVSLLEPFRSSTFFIYIIVIKCKRVTQRPRVSYDMYMDAYIYANMMCLYVCMYVHMYDSINTALSGTVSIKHKVNRFFMTILYTSVAYQNKGKVKTQTE